MPNIAWFKEVGKDDIDLVGGKGASLGEMYSGKLPIPPGFIVTAEAYKKFLKATEIADEIYSLLKDLDVENNSKLQEASKKIKHIIMRADMPKDLREEILESYENMNIDENILKVNKPALDIIKSGSEPPFVAVRSSATAEDLPSIAENEHVFVKVNGQTKYCTIKELYEDIGNGMTTNLEVPSMVDNKMVWTKAEQIYKHWAKGNRLYKITTNFGKEVTITPNHSLIVLNPNSLKPQITQIDKITKEDLIPTSTKIPETNLNLKYLNTLDYVKGKDVIEENEFIMIKNNSLNWKIQNKLPKKIEVTKDFLYFLGLYVAEGCTYKNNCIMITNSKPQIQERIKNYLSSINLYQNQRINKYTIRVYCKTLVRLLHELTGKPLNIKGKGKSCKIKKVPDFVFSLKKELIAEFLKGCFDGDGFVTKNGIIQYTSASWMLIGGITKLLEILNFELSINKKNNCFNLSIPAFETKKFIEIVGSDHPNKLLRLKNNLKEFNRKKLHPKFKQNLTINKELKKIIRTNLEKNLPKEKINIAHCPLCSNQISKNNRYKEKQRYYCSTCKKSFYENEINFIEKEKYVSYGSKGRFKKGAIPHNKAILSNDLSINKFKKLMKNYGTEELAEQFSGDIRWERIKNIEPIDYRGYVYDFTVPNIENFVSGVGGIITHNTASFAGQQATFLNVKGSNGLINAVKSCWASLFTARAIYYRVKNDFPHDKVFIAVIVQKMVDSEKAGVMFSINPVTNNEDEILIEAGWGLGEAVVSGAVNPDKYIINKETLEIKDEKINLQDFMFVRDPNFGKTIRKEIPEDKRSTKVLDDFEINKLAELSIHIEKFYNKAQDMEFAIDKTGIYIVQSRPITTQKKIETTLSEKQEFKHGEEILSGTAASPGVATGKVKIVENVDQLTKVEKGDILVADMTNPDYVPAMQRAGAIVTNSGGTTSHAAIVGREMGIPVIVGTNTATETLKEEQEITVDATNGKIYSGSVEIQQKEETIEENFPQINTVTEIKVLLDIPEVAERAAKTKADGVGLLRCEFLMAKQKEHPIHMIKNGKKEQLIEILVDGIIKIAKAFEGKPVWYRTSDLRTDEYSELLGGDEEPEEDNPMMGLHGIRRGLAYPELLKTEFEAIKKVHEKGLTNVGVMLSMVSHLEQVEKSKEILKEVGLEPLENIEFGVMIETPGAVHIIEEICKEGIDFISFGTNDLTQFTLGVDRNNEHIQYLFDEMHPAVLRQIQHVIKVCREYNVETSICGQAGSDPEMAEFLVKAGIDSISANIDAVGKIRNTVAKIERKMLLDQARSKIEF